MARVAERAKVSRRTAHLHFPTRAELIRGLYGHLGEKHALQASLQWVNDAPDARTRLERWVMHVATAHAAIRPVALAVDRAVHDEEMRQYHEDVVARWHLGATSLAEQLDAAGCLRHDTSAGEVADVIWALMTPELLDRLQVRRGWSREQYADFLLRAISAYLVPDD